MCVCGLVSSGTISRVLYIITRETYAPELYLKCDATIAQLLRSRGAVQHLLLLLSYSYMLSTMLANEIPS